MDLCPATPAFVSKADNLETVWRFVRYIDMGGLALVVGPDFGGLQVPDKMIDFKEF